MIRGASRSREDGQSLVIVVFFLAVIMGFTAIGVDTGRMFSERRFLQNAADAAALAAATALTHGRTAAEAEAAARAVLERNFRTEPTGRIPASVSAVPIYAPGHGGDPRHLIEGILVTDGDVRVAVRNTIDYTFGRVIGMTTQEVSARARAGYAGGLLPIAVRQYIQAPGPEPGATSPCLHDENRFMAVFATADTACLGSDSDPIGRVDAGPGAPFDSANPDSDRANHGPIVAILGQRAAPSNAAQFRGFIALDIRNFATESSQVYYNGVTGGTSPDALKDVEMGWILRGGYPGPDFPAVTSPPHPNNQVAVLSGNSAGLAVKAVGSRFAPGDEILVAVYPGHVMAIPDFLISPPDTLVLPTTGTVATAGELRISRNQAFTGLVDLSTLPDYADPLNPIALGTLVRGDDGDPINFSEDPVLPALGNGTRVSLHDLTTAAAAPGVYAAWINGHAGDPYLRDKRVPVAIRIGDVVRDFELTADSTGKVAASVGDTVQFTLLLTNAPNRNTSFGGAVSMTLDTPLPAGTGATTFSATTAAPSRNGTPVTLTIQTGSLPPGAHQFVVRATGLNGDTVPRPVTHLLPLTINVAPTSTPGDDEYIDISGFAVMRVARVDANTVDAYAITPVVRDPSDPRLRRGATARLLTW